MQVLKAFALSSADLESGDSSEKLGGDSVSEAAEARNDTLDQLALNRRVVGGDAQPPSPPDRLSLNEPPESGKSSPAGPALVSQQQPAKPKSGGWPWRLGRRERPGSADAVLSGSVVRPVPKYTGPIVGGIPIIEGPLLLGDHVGNGGPANSPGFISAPVSAVTSPALTPMLSLLLGADAGASEGGRRPTHRRHASLLSTLGLKLSGRARSSASTTSSGGADDGAPDGGGPTEPGQGAALSALVLESAPPLPAGTRGIANVGNSCFVNAALQCLRFTPGLPLQLVPDLLEQAEQLSAAAAEAVAADSQPLQGMEPASPPAEAAGEQPGVAANSQRPAEAVHAAPAAVEPPNGEQCAQAGAGQEAQAILHATAPAAEHAAPAVCSNDAVGHPAAAEAAEPAAAAFADTVADGEQQQPTEGTAQQQQQQQHVPQQEQPLPKPAPAKVDLPARGELAASVAATVRDLYLGPAGNGRQSVDPSPLLRTLCRFPVAADLFDGGQHDCQELLHVLIDLLHEDLNRAAPAAKASHPAANDAETAAGGAAGAAKSSGGEQEAQPQENGRVHGNGVDAAPSEAGGRAGTAAPNSPLQNGVAPAMGDGAAQVEPRKAGQSEGVSGSGDESEECAKARGAWAACRTRDDSPISDLFVGQLQSAVTCSKCGGRFTMYEPFWDLSLPLAPKAGSLASWLGLKPGGALTIQDCLALFSAEERMEGSEAFHCERCGEKTAAAKRLRLHRLPDALVLHIKRFRHKGASTDKLTTNVAFPVAGLDLGPYLSPEAPQGREECLYDLYAVSNHAGSLGGGHYTAYCRVPQADSTTSSWYHFNDDTVTAVQQQAVTSHQAYILFYAKRKYADKALAAEVLNASAPPSEAGRAGKHRHSRSGSWEKLGGAISGLLGGAAVPPT